MKFEARMAIGLTALVLVIVALIVVMIHDANRPEYEYQKVEQGGHQFISVRHANAIIGFVHDPNCTCGKRR